MLTKEHTIFLVNSSIYLTTINIYIDSILNLLRFIHNICKIWYTIQPRIQPTHISVILYYVKSAQAILQKYFMSNCVSCNTYEQPSMKNPSTVFPFTNTFGTHYSNSNNYNNSLNCSFCMYKTAIHSHQCSQPIQVFQ